MSLSCCTSLLLLSLLPRSDKFDQKKSYTQWISHVPRSAEMPKHCQNSPHLFSPFYHTILLLPYHSVSEFLRRTTYYWLLLQLCSRKLSKVSKVSLKMKFRFPRIKNSSAQEAIKFGYVDHRNWDQCYISRPCVRELPLNCWPLCGNTAQQHSEILNMSIYSAISVSCCTLLLLLSLLLGPDCQIFSSAVYCILLFWLLQSIPFINF